MTEQNTSIREQAATEFEVTYPQPQPPTLPMPSRPTLVNVGADNAAHLWLDVDSDRAYRNVKPSPRARVTLYVIERAQGKDQRIQGELTADELDALIGELERVRDEVVAKDRFVRDTQQYEQILAAWDQAKGEHIRARLLEWEQAEAAKKNKKESGETS